MSKSDGRSDVKLTKELGIIACSCGRCCNAKLVEALREIVKDLEAQLSKNFIEDLNKEEL